VYRNDTFNNMSWILSTIGALNWGFKGLLGLDLVRSIFGEDSFVTRMVYTLVGVAGAWSAYHLISRATTPREEPAFGLGRFAERIWG
jgi:uncharacterized membrane protein YuzA (DUF378 family)